MTFTSIPQLQSVEHMRRQVLCFRPDASGQDILEFYIGAYGNHLGKLPCRKGGAEASYKEADRKGLP